TPVSNEPKEYILRQEGDRQIFELPEKGWPYAGMQAVHDAQPGDKIIVNSYAQEESLRWLLKEHDKHETVVLERGSGLVRFQAEPIDARATAKKLMEHLRGIRARHRGEDDTSKPD
ncbi:MAG: hypothetical protein WDZ49_03570, partial [Litorilinea sp.]